MNTPKRVYEQAIHNFPTESWFREISSEEFNDPTQDAMAVVIPTVIQLPTPTETRQPLLVAGVAAGDEAVSV
jgi:hypothetical protein